MKPTIYRMDIPEAKTTVRVMIKKTPKTTTITPIDEKPKYVYGCIDRLWDDGKIIIREYAPETHKVYTHYLADWGDGTYTLYPNRQGLPYYLEPEIIAN